MNSRCWYPLVALLLAAPLFGQSPECPDCRLAMDLPAELREWFLNGPEGNCVQCSIGMLRCHCHGDLEG